MAVRVFLFSSVRCGVQSSRKWVCEIVRMSCERRQIFVSREWDN